ncbi:MAG: alkylphosphonate utilization protein [Kofleriaceae bacterium]|nr:MAG: alkylphosphonate utilization protein [Kofleriaceae bacterium]
MSDLPPCPKCNSAYAYEDPSGLLVCPECGNEWSPSADIATVGDADGSPDRELVVRDAVGNILQDGDTVVLVKDLKVKGSPTGLKAGTKVKKIRLVDGDHNIDCRVEGIGQMGLKSEFVKKA